MISLIQRVSQASVRVEGELIGEIGVGLLVLLCAEQGDTEAQADKLLAKLLKLRIFSDDTGKMNRSVQDLDGQGTAGGLLIVSQFTLAADTSGGTPNAQTVTASAFTGLDGQAIAFIAGATNTGCAANSASPRWSRRSCSTTTSCIYSRCCRCGPPCCASPSSSCATPRRRRTSCRSPSKRRFASRLLSRANRR